MKNKAPNTHDLVCSIICFKPTIVSSIHFSISIDHTPNGPQTKLFIKSVQVHDEETYTCSVTYLEPSESCDSNGSYKIKLNVLGMYCSDRATTMKNEWENKAHYEMLLLICLFVLFFSIIPKIL